MTTSLTSQSASVNIQRHPAYFALTKATNTITYAWLIVLTCQFLDGGLDWKLSTGCVAVSGAWLILTSIKVEHLLQTYFDILSRIELVLPAVLGATLSLIALCARVYHPGFHLLAVAEILGWLFMFILFLRNLKRFEKQGHGPVPRGTWINPPAEVLRAGDLLLTSGNVARRLYESVSHSECVLEMPDGTKQLFSSYMEKGARIHSIESVTSQRAKGLYVGLHLATPLTDQQKAEAVKVAEEMVAANHKWKEEEKARIHKRIDFLPIPSQWKTKLRDVLEPSGYDWLGLFMGRTCSNRWTCIGAALVLYHKIGVRTNPYGTGLFGFGTSIMDPIMPVRFLADPAFKLITEQEKTLAPADSK